MDPDRLVSHALGDIDERSNDIDEHLSVCPTCANELESLRDTVALSREAALLNVTDRPPDRIWDGIASDLALDTRAPEQGTRHRALPAPPAQGRRVALLAAAAVAVGALATLAVLRPWESAEQVRASGPLAAAPGAPGGVSGTVSVLQTDGRAQLKVDAADLPTSTGFYEVWLYDPSNGRMVAMGDLGPDGVGSFPMPPGIDTARYDVVDVSAEPYDGQPAHSTHSVLRGGLPR